MSIVTSRCERTKLISKVESKSQLALATLLHLTYDVKELS